MHPCQVTSATASGRSASASGEGAADVSKMTILKNLASVGPGRVSSTTGEGDVGTSVTMTSSKKLGTKLD